MIPTSPDTTLVIDRFSLYRAPERASRDDFASDVRAGLTASPKRLAPRYFYDHLGSALFEAITQLPEYYLTRAELEILERYADEMVTSLGEPVELVEFGSGSARKSRVLVEAALRAQSSLTYRPIDISPTILDAASRALVAEFPALRVAAYASDYESVLGEGVLRPDGRALALFLGSNIGNFEPSEARALLRAMRGAFANGDGLLLGYDLKKDARTLELAYNDPTGVTAAFNRNLLARINRELGGAFDLDAFAFRAIYDGRRGSVDSFLVARRATNVPIAALGIDARFVAYEAVQTESSYKFDAVDVAALAASARMDVERTWFDDARRFAISLLRCR